MKKIFTIVAAILLTASAFAADRRPTVSVHSDNRRFEVVIDGRSVSGNYMATDISLRKGMHTVRVFEVSRGLFGKSRRMVSQRNFMVQNQDIDINIGYRGQISIQEDRNGRDWRNNGGYDRNDRDDRDYRNHDGRF